MQTETSVHDPFLRFLHGTLPEPGQSAFNVFSRQPGPHISRTFETGWMAGTKFETLGVPTNWVLTKGCAVAVCGDGLVRHCCPGYGLSRFCGFVESMLDGNRVTVRIAGVVMLKVQGLIPESKGREVFVLGPDEFTLDSTRGGLKVGTIKYVQDGKACVTFGEQSKSKKIF